MGLLRILLAVCVFCSHTVPLGNLRWLDGGYAVEMFFVISGFYMQLVLSTKYTKGKLGDGWISQFYKARYFRLLPLYLLGTVLVLSVALLRKSSAPLSIWSDVLNLPGTPGNVLFKVFLGFTNLTMLFQDVTMFLAVHVGQVHWSASCWNSDIQLWKGLTIPPAWSLGVELSFYLIAPYLLNLRSRWLAIIVGCSLAVKIGFLTMFQLQDPWTYRFFPFEIGYFLLGSLAFRYRARLDSFVPERIARFWAYPFVLCLVTLSVPVGLGTIVYPVVLTCVVPLLFRVTAKSRADRWIGELSYPFYMFHLFAIALAASLGRRWGSNSETWVAYAGFAVTLALSIGGLVLESRFVEPWRVRFTEKRESKPAVVATVREVEKV